MVQARQALTSRLLTRTSCRTISNRRSNQFQISYIKSLHPTHGPLEKRSGRTSPQTPHTNLFNLDNKYLTREERARLVDRRKFVPWLTHRLEHLVTRLEHDDAAQQSEEKDFAAFLKNLIPVLRGDSTWFPLSSVENKAFRTTSWQPTGKPRSLSLFEVLKEAYIADGQKGVDAQLKYSFSGLVANQAFSEVDRDDQKQLADLRYPIEWYPATRQMQRVIHLHVGPTNSGKTYHALKRLEQAKSGIYAGPLRLLAHEVYTRLNAQGKVCDLITGDEQKYATSATKSRMKSCTVEMVPLNVSVDVAIIDEIQMIGDEKRGWAWTQALLGCKAKELHLCGEERTVPLIRELAASMGDKLEIHTYKRLSPLKVMSTSLQGDLRGLRKGDCLVVFSRIGIHSMKNEIEKITGKRVAIVYGSLPPDVRAQQAALFNDPDNEFDYLVASDAVGMGLNLAIKRIIFETVTKFNGTCVSNIPESQVKQIAGRAGRFRIAGQPQSPMKANMNSKDPSVGGFVELSAAPTSMGLVTSLEEADLPMIRKSMRNEAEPIMTAGLFPPASILEKFAVYFPPSTSFGYIMTRLHELSTLHPRYHLCELKTSIGIADVIHPIRGLTTNDRIILCAAPANTTQSGMPEIVAAYARCIGQNKSGKILSIPEIPLETLDEKVRPDREYIRRLEKLHKALILYLWLSYRFTGVFVDQDMAFYVKGLTEEKIDTVLTDFSSSSAVMTQIRALKRETALQQQKMDDKDQHSDEPQTTDDIVDDFLTRQTSSETLGRKDLDFNDRDPEFRTSQVEDLPDAGKVVSRL